MPSSSTLPGLLVVRNAPGRQRKSGITEMVADENLLAVETAVAEWSSTGTRCTPAFADRSRGVMQPLLLCSASGCLIRAEEKNALFVSTLCKWEVEQWRGRDEQSLVYRGCPE